LGRASDICQEGIVARTENELGMPVTTFSAEEVSLELTFKGSVIRPEPYELASGRALVSLYTFPEEGYPEFTLRSPYERQVRCAVVHNSLDIDLGSRAIVDPGDLLKVTADDLSATPIEFDTGGSGGTVGIRFYPVRSEEANAYRNDIQEALAGFFAAMTMQASLTSGNRKVRRNRLSAVAKMGIEAFLDAMESSIWMGSIFFMYSHSELLTVMRQIDEEDRNAEIMSRTGLILPGHDDYGILNLLR
jgi:hypothetical protein